MKLLIVSGLSGSGKSIALDTLEDCGYYCIDNLPVTLLEDFISHVMLVDIKTYAKTAIGIDARNQSESLAAFSESLLLIRSKGIDCEIIFMQAEEATLLKRYSETRRRHPLTDLNIPLKEALKLEKEMLTPIAKHASVVIDTSRTHYHQLRDLIRYQIGERDITHISLQFQSFGFKHGVPLDADFVFDARSLPNPYWVPDLRGLTGKDQPVVDFLKEQPLVGELLKDVIDFLQRWIPRFEAEGRSYLTVAIGCTGGQHRSVYLVDALARHFKTPSLNVIARHRELN
ncbi:MAG: RNase adapter RapZ [Methylococcaceae bacterium]|nr:RNase adapter RapZ [Methylococcaceae bacterium]MDZ4155978.1 RNase adapter RapZ [Methylococcales bacterium]MDP2395203.1 RNase adapter RapZ [Methylococcaceae bacterium]MDP3018655.1 RNase adapter RapZ [Methylococcaceae bacterium]MDP3388849.1 RNase adapter RapZ [Methylococcaceae bacterium]